MWKVIPWVGVFPPLPQGSGESLAVCSGAVSPSKDLPWETTGHLLTMEMLPNRTPALVGFGYPVPH